MRFRRPFVAGASAILLTLTLAVPAQSVEPGYYAVPYDSTVYRVKLVGSSLASSGEPITYDDWARAGFPQPRMSDVTYSRYEWSSSIVATLPFTIGARLDGFRPESNVAGPNQHLTYDQWVRASRPQAQAVGWMTGSNVARFASSSELMIYGVEPGHSHRLTPQEWASTGFQPFFDDRRRGFYRYPWSTDIGYVQDTVTGEGLKMTYEQWVKAGAPTPQTVSRISGERVWKRANSPVIYLNSTIVGHHELSADQWRQMGSPTPEIW